MINFSADEWERILRAAADMPYITRTGDSIYIDGDLDAESLNEAVNAEIEHRGQS